MTAWLIQNTHTLLINNNDEADLLIICDSVGQQTKIKLAYLTQQQIAMPSNIKIHHYKLVFTLHEINISVKFPCSVAASLKTDAKEIEIHKDFKLTNGNAKIENVFDTDFKLVYNTKLKQYTENKVSVLVYLKSSSGRIPAGSANVPIKSDKEVKSASVNIEKCPDKSASVLYSLRMVLLHEEQGPEESQQIHSRSTINLHENGPSGMIPVTNEYRYASRDGSNRHIRTEMYNSRVSSRSGVLKDPSPNTPVHLSYKNIDEVKNYQRDKSEASIQSQSQSRISRMIMKQHQNQVSSQRQKIMQLEKDKSKALKQIRTLKQELQANSLRNSGISEKQHNSVVSKHQSRIVALQEQVDKQKSKASQFQSQAHKRKIKVQELEKDIKIIQRKLEQAEQELKKQTLDKEQLALRSKDLSNQLREVKQKYEDLVLTHENFVKRSEFKENVYKQQLKNINQKYTISESEKQKLLFEKSEIIAEHEERQKKDRDSFRMKERTLTEERAKLMRKIDNLEKQMASKKQQKQGTDQQITELQSLNRKNRSFIEQLQSNIEDLKRENQSIKTLLDKQLASRKVLQTQLQNTEKIDEQKKIFRRTVAEKQQQISQLNKTKMNLQITKKALAQKCQQFQSQLKQKNAANKVLQKQFENLTKKFQALKKSQQQKSKQINEITFIKQNEQSKVYGLSEEIRQIQRKYKMKELQANKQIENINNKMAELEQELQEISEKNFILSQDKFENQKCIAEMKNAYEEKLTEIDKLQVMLHESKLKVENLQYHVKQITSQNLQSSQRYESELIRLQKFIKQIQKQNKQYQMRLQRNIRTADQGVNKLNSQLKNCQLELKNKDKQLYELRKLREQNQGQIASLANELQQITLQCRQKSKELAISKDAVQIIKKQKIQLQGKLDQCLHQIQNYKEDVRNLIQNLQDVQKQKEQTGGDIKKAKKQLEKFKANNQYFLKTFFNMMSQPDCPEVVNVTHEDPEVVKGMMQALKKKKSYKVEHDKHVEQLNQFNENLQRQIDQLNGVIQAKAKQIEDLTIKLQQNIKMQEQVQKQNQKIKEDLLKKIDQHQKKNADLTKQIQDLESGGNNLSEIINKKANEIEDLNNQNSMLKKMITSLEQKAELINLKSNEEIKNILNSTNSTMDQLKAQFDNVKVRLQQQQNKRKNIACNNERNLQEIDDLKEKVLLLQRQNKIIVQHKNNLEKQAQQLKNTVAERQEKIAEYQFLHSNTYSQLQVSNEQAKHLRQKILNLEIVNKGLSEKYQRLEVRWKENVENLKQKQKQLDEEKKRYDTESKKTARLLENQKKIRSNLQNKAKQQDEKNVEIQNQLKQARKQMESMNKRLTLLYNESAGQKQKLLKENETSNKKTEQIVKQKDFQIEKLRNQLQQAKAERDFLSNNVECAQKNMEQIIEQKQKLQKDLSKEIQNLKKQNLALSKEIAESTTKVKNLQNSLTDLSRNFQNYQMQNNNQASYMQPIAENLSKLQAQTNEYLKFMGQFEASKTKLIKIGNYKLQTYIQRPLGQIVREINIAAQRCKMQIINKSKIPQEDRTAIVEQFKTLQGSIEKIIRL